HARTRASSKLTWKKTQWLSLGGELRERFEYYSAPNFGIQGEPANGYFLHRLLLHADLHLGDSARAFVQIASNLSSGKDNAAPPYVDEVDVQQAFIDLRLPIAVETGIDPVVRIGRQEMAFGSQRIIAVRDAPNVRRNYDGFRIVDSIGTVRSR